MRALTWARPLAALAAMAGFTTGGAALAYDEPSYEVLASFDAVEIRRYDPYVVAEATVEADFNRARRDAFGTLFRYISGDNVPREKISMTVPVQQRRSRTSGGQKIAMTVPVVSRSSDEGDGVGWTMAFIMPPGATIADLPVPADERVRLRQVPARIVAAWRYSGNTGERRFREHAEQLQQLLAERGVALIGEPVQAVYNGPFTLGPFRRNEALAEVREETLANVVR